VVQEREKRKFMLELDISRSELEHLIDEWIIGKNSERDRKILKRRLLDGICYEPLAEEFDLSVQQIKNIIYKSQNKLFKHI
jgi:DNA-directed RNA polymerase specialized sigma24 family protein